MRRCFCRDDGVEGRHELRAARPGDAARASFIDYNSPTRMHAAHSPVNRLVIRFIEGNTAPTMNGDFSSSSLPHALPSNPRYRRSRLSDILAKWHQTSTFANPANHHAVPVSLMNFSSARSVSSR